jgi:hypothetical protein
VKDKNDPLNEAFDRLEQLLPDKLSPAFRWLRSPSSRLVRIPLGILCIIGSLLWFLPALGLWLLPVGLLLIAQDVPFLRRPVGRFTLWLISLYERLRKAWKHHQAAARRGH